MPIWPANCARVTPASARPPRPRPPVADAQAAAEEQVRVAEQMAQLAERLAAEDYAPAERADLARLQTESAQIGYDAAAHERVRKEVERLAPFDARYQRQLLPALDGESEARTRVTDLAAQLARREADLSADRAEVARLSAAVADLPRLQAALDRATAAVESTAAAERRARQNEGAAMQQLSALDALAERRGKLAADLDGLNAEIAIYNQLREAFGKKGLQAMIIESAIPEVETEANRLLGRMTEGRMSLRLETQREKVTGGVAETLDIVISDELGARPYEMYSGGESFSRQPGAAHRHQQAAGAPRRRAASDAGDRRGLRLAGRAGPIAGHRGDQLDPARLRAHHRDHPHRGAEGHLSCPHRCGEDSDRIAGEHRLKVAGDRLKVTLNLQL